MTELIDISLPLRNGMVVWPTSVGFHLTQTMKMEDGDIANNSRLDTDVHVGTHVDAPWHSLKNGATVEQLSLEAFIGPVYVAHLPEVAEVTDRVLEQASIPKGTERLLLHTKNSKLWATNVNEFRKDFVALTADAARWIVKRGIRLIGVDYLSVQRFTDSMLTHEILLEANVVIVEGLNMTNVEPGTYELICLPLRLVGSEGAPARAVLRRIPQHQVTK